MLRAIGALVDGEPAEALAVGDRRTRDTWPVQIRSRSTVTPRARRSRPVPSSMSGTATITPLNPRRFERGDDRLVDVEDRRRRRTRHRAGKRRERMRTVRSTGRGAT